MLEDEGVIGSAHIGIGTSITLGGVIKAPTHYDLIMWNPTIVVDGVNSIRRYRGSHLDKAAMTPPCRYSKEATDETFIQIGNRRRVVAVGLCRIGDPRMRPRPLFPPSQSFP